MLYSDRSLRSAKTGLRIKVILVTIANACFSLYLFVCAVVLSAAGSYSYYGYRSSNPMEGWMWFFALAYVAVTVLVSVSMWKLGMLKIWTAYDVKLIRDKTLGLQNSTELATFGGTVAAPTAYAAPVAPVVPTPTYTAPAPVATGDEYVICPSCGETVRKSSFCGKCGSMM